MRNLPATSFLENKGYGLQAREQGFPKLCPILSESRYHVISWACNEASNLGGRIYATVPEILLKAFDWEVNRLFPGEAVVGEVDCLLPVDGASSLAFALSIRLLSLHLLPLR